MRGKREGLGGLSPASPIWRVVPTDLRIECEQSFPGLDVLEAPLASCMSELIGDRLDGQCGACYWVLGALEGYAIRFTEYTSIVLPVRVLFLLFTYNIRFQVTPDSWIDWRRTDLPILIFPSSIWVLGRQ